MKLRQYLLYLEDILESSSKVQRYTAGMEFEEFIADERTFDAVMRNLEVIGKAAKGSTQSLS
uniref:HepT-like ribonuclease domain-containing protein n=1 Tax=Chroococcidiopsis sp. TS-821 TaxID=1378066 RepID=UPI0030DBA2C6